MATLMNGIIDMKGKIFTWDEILERADNKGFLSPELKAKDEAGWQMEALIEQVTGKDIRNEECVEDEITEFIENTMNVLFDEFGNICFREAI